MACTNRKGGVPVRAPGQTLGPAMTTTGLGLKWEANEALRGQVRQHSLFMVCQKGQKWAEPSRVNAVANMEVLLPCLELLRETPEWRLPHLQSLKADVRLFFDKVGFEADECLVYRHAMEIKKLLGLLKRKAMRKEVTKVSGYKKQGRHDQGPPYMKPCPGI